MHRGRVARRGERAVGRREVQRPQPNRSAEVVEADGVVVEAEQGRVFAFEVFTMRIPVARWSYEFAERDGGCTVTERWADRRPGWFVPITRLATGVTDRSVRNEETMRVTLRTTQDGGRNRGVIATHLPRKDLTSQVAIGCLHSLWDARGSLLRSPTLHHDLSPFRPGLETTAFNTRVRCGLMSSTRNRGVAMAEDVETAAPTSPMLLDPESSRHPQPMYKMMRDFDPIFRIENAGVVVTKHADVEQIFKQPEIFSSAMSAADLGNIRPLIPLQIDLPQHRVYRKILQPIFSRRR